MRVRPFQARSQIDGVADHGRVHAFVRTNVADDDFALIDADTHSQRHPAFSEPSFIQLLQRAPHPDRRAHRSFCIFGLAETAHVPPTPP